MKPASEVVDDWYNESTCDCTLCVYLIKRIETLVESARLEGAKAATGIIEDYKEEMRLKFESCEMGGIEANRPTRQAWLYKDKMGAAIDILARLGHDGLKVLEDKNDG